MNNIPNKIKQPSQCCFHCGKTYKIRTNLEKHINLCELLHKSKTRCEEDEDEIPSQKKMYKMMLELAQKYNRLEEKVDEIGKWVIKKKKTVNVLDWLNVNITPETVFERLPEKIIIYDEDINYLLNNTFYDTLNEIFLRTIYTISENEYPIFAFVQKNNVFYVYDKIEEHKFEWHELSREKLIKFLSIIHMKLAKYFYEWKKNHMEEIRESDSFAMTCDKTLIKLMSIEFKQEAIFNRVRSQMFNKMKTDMKALVEYEFEF